MASEASNTATATTAAIISAATARNLSDKLHEKRKIAATEIETLMKGFASRAEEEQIRRLIEALTNQYALSTNSQARKGGLIGLAGCAIGLGQEMIEPHLFDLVTPILRCMNDVDSKVRYSACEAMFNVSKVAREKILAYFNDIFEALCKAFADPEAHLKNAAQLLDRLIKDIVTEVQNFDVKSFIPVLKDRIHVVNPNVRQFLLGWINVMDSCPDINMLEYLPDFLNGIFVMLSDPNKELRRQADASLTEFLSAIKREGSVEYRKIMTILTVHCLSKDDFTRLTAINWCREFIILGKESLLEDAAEILNAILSSLSHESEEMRNCATLTNDSLMLLLADTSQSYDYGRLFDVLYKQLTDQWVPTRMAVLKWIWMLHSKSPEKMDQHMDSLFPVLMKTLADDSDEVVRLDLKVLSRLASIDRYFTQFVTRLLAFFRSERNLLRSRGSTVIRHVCLSLDKEKVYRTLSQSLEQEQDLDFAATMVQNLNMILLISPELLDLRNTLKDLNNPKGKSLFVALYRSWCHNPAAVFSLCLLTQAYEHASHLIARFSELEITVSFLMEIDKLVQLIESPIFIHLRLQLLEPERYPYLYKSLYGMMMILPQSSAFSALRNRLTSVATLGLLHLLPERFFSSSFFFESHAFLIFHTLPGC
eukprot:TRINITY_DN4973_c0_g1_i1.p1 TRINITY_DN4973_c0_g1~~TRINITY_DN4973_c0_g1_i1.p1  ORF type:complete len:651 (+),score=111.84 TRINITY_DN4973_c0_g1_i1:58-2010(+)